MCGEIRVKKSSRFAPGIVSSQECPTRGHQGKGSFFTSFLSKIRGPIFSKFSLSTKMLI